MMQFKAAKKIDIKQIGEAGTFEGLLSPYGNIDSGNDVVERGAYTKNLKEQGATRPLLWSHKTDTPIGSIELEDRPDGLWCKGKLLLDLQQAKDAYACIKANIVKGLSIGFESMEDSIQNGVRHLKQIKLYEGSLVLFPMNTSAQISSVKSRQSKQAADGNTETPGDFNDELAEIQLWDMPYQTMRALQNSIAELFWCNGGLSKDQILAAFGALFSQFSEAYMAFLPDYLDAMSERYGGMEAWSARVAEIKSKGLTKLADGVELTADCFAFVGDPTDLSTWKLPIKFPGDEEKTKAHIRNALARYSLTDGIPEAEEAKVLAKIQAAAKKYGIDVSDGKSIEIEVKAGAAISAANKKSIQTACDQLISAHETLSALVADEAADGTSEGKAALADEENGLIRKIMTELGSN